MAFDIQDSSHLYLRSSNNNGDVTGSSPILEPDVSVKGDASSASISATSGAVKGSTASGTPNPISISNGSQTGSIITDSAPIDSASHTKLATIANTTPTQAPQATSTTALIPAPQHGLSTSKLTAVIVVPIIFVAIVSPILIVWFISWRRRTQLLKGHRHRRTLHESKLLELQNSLSSVSSQGEERNARPRSSAHLREAAQPGIFPQPRIPPQTRNSAQSRSSALARSSTQIPIHPNASAQPRPSSHLRPPSHPRPLNSAPPHTSTPLDPSFNGFNFDLPRNASARPLSPPQPSVSPLSTRRSLPRIRSPPPAYTSRPMTLASPEFPPRIETPVLLRTPLVRPLRNSARRQSSQPPHIISATPHIRSTSSAFADHDPEPARPPPQPNTDSFSNNPSPAPHTTTATTTTTTTAANLRSPFSSGLDSPAISDISGLSFDHSLWIATQRPGVGGGGFLGGLGADTGDGVEA